VWRTLEVLDRVIDGSNPQEPVCRYYPGDDLFMPYGRRRGLPIGKLTSQFFAELGEQRRPERRGDEGGDVGHVKPGKRPVTLAIAHGLSSFGGAHRAPQCGRKPAA
jgi:hypothetical protein